MFTYVVFLFLFQTSGGTITGTLTDYDSKDPIYGAKIVLERTAHKTTTDKNGKYTMSNIPPGTYRLSILHGRYPGGGPKSIVVKRDSISIFDLRMMAASAPPIQFMQADTTKPG